MNNDQQIIQQGIDAETLLNNSTFVAVMNVLSQQHIAAVFGSKPNEQETREWHYSQARALDSIVATLNQWVAAKDQLIFERETRDFNEE
ncbi:hypothetical protein GAY31_11405 [Azospirillum brasilense]|nr:hypothetical protein [Azospirillum brasilense]